MSREPPHAIEHEKKLLAAMLLKEGQIIADVAEQLTAADFYRPEHRAIYRTIIDIYNEGTPPNFLLIEERLKKNGELDKITRQYLVSVVDKEFSAARWKSYAATIKETARLRKLINVSEAVLEKAYNGAAADDLQAQLEEAMTSATSSTGIERADKIAADVFLHVRALKPGELTGVTTGLWDLDKVTNGLQNGDLIILAARPSMGKTALALDIAHNAACKGKSVLMLSLEMSKAQLGMRLLSSTSGVGAHKIRTGDLTDGNRADMVNALDDIADLPLYIDDTGIMTVGAIRAKAKKFQRDHGLDLIVIDYVQLMVGDRAKGDNRVQEVSEISRSLKGLAKYLNVPVLVLSQLNRQAEQRADKRPQLSDLRESGSLEQDADIVMFLYRDEYYTREECETPDVAELNIAKNRNGATGTVRLHFSKATTAFKDLTRIEY